MPGGVPSIAEEHALLLDYSVDNDATPSFTLPKWVTFVGVLIPDLTNNANVGIEMSRDDTNFYPVLDVLDGADCVICASGSDPGFVDVTDYIRAFMPDNTHKPTYFRFTLSVAEDTADKTFYLYLRG